MTSAVDAINESVKQAISEVLDLEVIDRLLRDTSVDFLPSLIEVFEAESVQRVDNIDKALERGDLAVLSVEAHSLKGTSATFGAEALRSLSEKIEKSASMGDLPRVQELTPLVAGRVSAVLAALNQFAQELNV